MRLEASSHLEKNHVPQCSFSKTAASHAPSCRQKRYLEFRPSAATITIRTKLDAYRKNKFLQFSNEHFMSQEK